ncbi:uncharacterized protein LOC110068439 [Orbicella faveolata]|uniref:uncharacterized protein LOC110068439 n=1 Tax=Orbicella faveolata TaxID=48498 RepID=UPI0009E5F351|nr:uncharacterized protein LOC110068439 [Orbicella faveolata]
MCLNTELYGCSGEQAQPSAPTPLLQASGMCIKPQRGKCQPPDGTILVLTKSKPCDQPFMQFTLSADGTLKHHCSGKMVCQRKPAQGKRCELMISSKCQPQDAKFERTAAHSLRHKPTGKCLHLYGGAPAEGVECCLWQGCDEERTKVTFMKQDCALSLGISRGDVRDNQLTASSTLSDEWLPKYARLNGPKAWCGKPNDKSDKDEYLQIDLGKVQMVTRVAVEGKEWDLVEGYYLWYSQDGKEWKAYSESGDKLEANSYCHLGKCADTADTQCSDLWGGTARSAGKACWEKYNSEGTPYGTCDAAKPKPCAKRLDDP